MDKPVYLGLSILKLNKILMYEFWYDHVKSKYGAKAKIFIWIQKVLSYRQKQMVFIKIL